MLTGNLRRLGAQFLEWQKRPEGVVVTPELAGLLAGRLRAMALLAEAMERATPAPAAPLPPIEPGGNVVVIDFAAASQARNRARRATLPEGGAA